VSTVHDTYGDSDSWIELYNPGSDTVDLSGWHLTVGQGTVHHFGYDNDSLKMAPMDHLLLWADGEPNEGVDHLGITLPGSTCVRLIKPILELSDSICYSGIPADFTFGRESDGAINWVVFTSPTPDSNNVQLNTGIVYNGAATSNLAAYPNPAAGGIVAFNRSIGFVLYNVLGQEIARYTRTAKFDTSSLESGCYLILTDEHEVLRLMIEKD
jgi:hypothetical protein